MKISGELTSKDFMNFQRYYYYNKKIKLRILIVLVFALVIPIVFGYEGLQSLTDYLVGALLYGAVFAIIFLGLGYLSLYLTKRTPSKKGSIVGNKIYEVLDEGFKEETANSQNLVRWAGVKSLDQNQKYMFLFIDNVAAYIIPKRFFSTEEELEEFEHLVKEKIAINNL